MSRRRKVLRYQKAKVKRPGHVGHTTRVAPAACESNIDAKAKQILSNSRASKNSSTFIYVRQLEQVQKR
jgi:hypothetical protein